MAAPALEMVDLAVLAEDRNERTLTFKWAGDLDLLETVEYLIVPAGTQGAAAGTWTVVDRKTALRGSCKAPISKALQEVGMLTAQSKLEALTTRLPVGPITV